MPNEINPGQEELFAPDPTVSFDVEQFAGHIAKHASRFVPPDRIGAHEDVTGVNPDAHRVTFNGPGGLGWSALREKVG